MGRFQGTYAFPVGLPFLEHRSCRDVFRHDNCNRESFVFYPPAAANVTELIPSDTFNLTVCSLTTAELFRLHFHCGCVRSDHTNLVIGGLGRRAAEMKSNSTWSVIV